MEEEKILKEFVSFLKKHRAHKRYMHNIKPENQGWPEMFPLSSIVDLLHGDPSLLIWSAFSFANVKEGTIYWAKLAREWEFVYKNLKKKKKKNN